MGRPSKLPILLAVLGSLAAVVAICLVTGDEDKLGNEILNAPERGQTTSRPGDVMPAGGVMLPFELENGEKQLGDVEAAVQITAFIPSAGHGGCGNETAVLLHAIQQANPDDLFVHVVDFDSTTGVQLQQRTQTSCAGLLINGRQAMMLELADGTKKDFNFKDNLGDQYDEEGLWLALDHEFMEAYGRTPARPKDEPESEDADTGDAPAPEGDGVDAETPSDSLSEEAPTT